jgi:FixJ family two-component response regulator
MTTQKAVVHVVDDDPSWRTSVQRLMSAVGYGVALYETAEQFLEASAFDAPGCVLIDMRMPGLTGLQLQERLVAMRRRLTVVFVSGHGDIPTSVLAMRSGAEDFPTKPVDADRYSCTRRARDRVVTGRRRDRRALPMPSRNASPVPWRRLEHQVFDLVASPPC